MPAALKNNKHNQIDPLYDSGQNYNPNAFLMGGDNPKYSPTRNSGYQAVRPLETYTNPYNEKEGGYYMAGNGVNYVAPKATTNSSSGSSSSGGSSSRTNDRYADYRATLDDLYNKVMGYGSYSPGSYSAKYDTSGLEGRLNGWLNEIDSYGDFEYDLNADLLYKQMADNYIQQGQLAMQDAMANAAALTGGYGNSFAASVGNQAYQQHLTALNNNIPALQQQALNVWQAGLDQLYGQLDAGSQQLNNLLALEAQNFAQWQANENNRLNAWNAGYQQLLDQYNLGVSHIGNLETYQPKSSSSGSSSSKNSTAATSTTGLSVDAFDKAAAELGVTPLEVQKYATAANKQQQYTLEDMIYALYGKR